jgi:hypothetical protein
VCFAVWRDRAKCGAYPNRCPLHSVDVSRRNHLKNTKLFVLALVTACTLSMAPLAGAATACKSGQKTAQKGASQCTPQAAAKVKAKASRSATTKSTAKSATKPKGKTKASSRAQGKGKGRSPDRVQPAEPLQIRAAADCESTQVMLQGAAGQCPAVPTPAGLTLPNAPRANPGAACFEALAASNAARRLAHKVPFLAASAASPQALDNQGVPGKMERQELGSVIAGYGMCLDMAASWRAQTYAPAVVSALHAYWLDAQGILNALAAGKKSFGDAARAIADNDQATKFRIGTLERVANTQTSNPAQ